RFIQQSPPIRKYIKIGFVIEDFAVLYTMPQNSPIETSGVVKALVWSAACTLNNSHVQFWGDVRANLNGCIPCLRKNE
ncbi:hypothetical protein ACTMMD_17250, partial [Escherichia coli]|uniref:hypothetical protein n=1 Tax=Escherichia coli TaxID=562 RepID=UPI003F8C9CB9